MDIVKVVVHALDHQMKTVVLSEKQVNLNQDDPIDTFVLRLSKSLSTSSTTAKGVLKESSFLHDCIGQSFDFMGTSARIAKHWFDLQDPSSLYTSCNLIFAMIDMEDSFLYVMFEVNSKPGYVSIVSESTTDIQYQGRVLTESFGSVKNAFSLDLSTGTLMTKAPLKTQEIMEEVLDCDIYLNTKHAVTVLQTVVSALSESRHEEPVQNAIKSKTMLLEQSALFDEIDPKIFLEQVFEDMSDKDQSLVEDAFEANHLEDSLSSKNILRLRAPKYHTIVTESGVEVKLPLDSCEIDNVLELKVDEQGYATIHLKNLGKIVSV